MFCDYKAVLLFTRGSQSMERKNEDTSLLLKHLQEGDERAFRTLFEEFYASLCLFATRYLGDREEAADVVQETFLKYWNKHTDFDDYRKIKSFLYVVVRHACLNYCVIVSYVPVSPRSGLRILNRSFEIR